MNAREREAFAEAIEYGAASRVIPYTKIIEWQRVLGESADASPEPTAASVSECAQAETQAADPVGELKHRLLQAAIFFAGHRNDQAIAFAEMYIRLCGERVFVPSALDSSHARPSGS